MAAFDPVRRLPHGRAPTTAIGVGGAYLTASLLGDDGRVVAAAYHAGARHFDTAPPYGMGTSEVVLGRALRGHRDQVTIASKVGLPRQPAGLARRSLRSLWSPLRSALTGIAPRPPAPDSSPRRGDFSPATMIRSLEASLTALGTDYLDLCLLHEPTPADITDELLLQLDRFRRDGKLLATGIAGAPHHTAEIITTHPGAFDVAQTAWHILAPEPVPDAVMPIRHRALMYGYAPLRDRLRRDPALAARLSIAANRDLVDPQELARVLIGAAIAANPTGITLVASRRPSRIAANVRAGLDPANLAAGQALLTALAPEG